jgi:hypothetical protein
MKTQNHFKKFLKIIRVEGSSYNSEKGIFIDCLASTKPELNKSYLVNLSPKVSLFLIRELQTQLKKCKQIEYKNKSGGFKNEKDDTKKMQWL